MKIENKKTTKKNPSAVAQSEDLLDDTAPESEDSEEETVPASDIEQSISENASSDDVKRPVSISTSPVVATVKKGGKDDLVRFIPTELIEPPPNIGGYNVARALRITKMMPKHDYMIPRNVGEFLEELRKGIIAR